MDNGLELLPEGFLFDQKSRVLARQIDGHKTWLYPNDSRLLELLLRNQGSVVSKETIAECIWGSDSSRSIERRIRQSIHVLRQTLGGDAISTDFGKGYSLSPDIRLSTENTSSSLTPQETTFRKKVPIRSLGYIVFVSSMVMLTAVVSLFLEIAYSYEDFAEQALVASFPIAGIAWGGAFLSLFMLQSPLFGKQNTMEISALSIIFVSLMLCILIGFQVLPPYPVTKTSLSQTQTSQFAYAKNLIFYLFPIFSFFVLFPFALFMRGQKQTPDTTNGFDGSKFRIPSVSVFLVVFVIYSIYSTVTTFYLLDNLVSDANQNLFSLLLLTRNFCLMSIAIGGMYWWHQRCTRLKDAVSV